MPEPETDQNRAVVDALRETFAPLTQQLTPDVEPAAIYSAEMRFPVAATEKPE